MPRDGSGVASKPAGTTFSPNTTIESSKVNGVLDDIYALLNEATPITAGGTGGVTAAAARTNLAVPGLATENVFTKTQIWAKGADVASATALTTTDDGNYFDITGTTAITSIATVGVGAAIKLHFDGVLTLTHHATDLILPTAADITTAAGDEAEFVEYATGDWRCVSYTRASGSALVTLTLGTPVSISSSGTTFTGIPSWAKRVRVMLVGVSLSGSANIFVRLGDSGGVENTGYTGQVVQINSSPSVSGATFSAGFQLTIGTDPAYAWETTIELNLIDPSLNRWLASGAVCTTADARVNIVTGYKALSGTLDRIQILQSAADTFDSGQVNVSWE